MSRGAPRRGSTWLLALAAIAAASVGVAAFGRDAPRPVAATGTLQALFTPGDAIDDVIIAAIGDARREILVNAYSFTSRRIARALVAAQGRGVHVRVIADREQAAALPHNVLADLASGGVDVAVDGNYQASHNKVMVIDAEGEHAVTLTGSYNFTVAAQRSNAENLLVLRDNREIAGAYRANWQRLRARAAPWDGAAGR